MSLEYIYIGYIHQDLHGKRTPIYNIFQLYPQLKSSSPISIRRHRASTAEHQHRLVGEEEPSIRILTGPGWFWVRIQVSQVVPVEPEAVQLSISFLGHSHRAQDRPITPSPVLMCQVLTTLAPEVAGYLEVRRGARPPGLDHLSRNGMQLQLVSKQPIIWKNAVKITSIQLC